jgi:hypothetical protein
MAIAHQNTKPARLNKFSHPTRCDSLRRIAAKQGFYDGQNGVECDPYSYYKDQQIIAYCAGYALGADAEPGEKHPFGEIANQRVPA